MNKQHHLKQFLVYLILILSPVLLFAPVVFDEVNDFFRPQNEDYSGGFGSQNLSAPQSALRVMLAQGIECDDNNTFNELKNIMIYLAIAILIMSFSGYFFARKTDLPGIYNQKHRKFVKVFIISTLVFVLFSDIIIISTDALNNVSSAFIESLGSLIILLAGVFSAAIIHSIISCLFLFSIFYWLLNIILKDRISKEKIQWAAELILPALLFGVLLLLSILSERFAGLFSFDFESIVYYISLYIVYIFLMRKYISGGLISAVLYAMIMNLVIISVRSLLFG